MNGLSWTILCFAYIAGLFSTALVGGAGGSVSGQGWVGLALGWLGLGVVARIFAPRLWRRVLKGRREVLAAPPKPLLWFGVGLVGALAVVYLQGRWPQPGANDISSLVPQLEGPVAVRGKILEMPTLNRQQNLRFLLAADRVGDREVSGKVYVTLPLLQGTGLYPGSEIALAGRLYQPRPAKNPGSFDFQAFLARQGVFAGVKGTLVETPQERPLGWWKLRQRIVRAQVRPLGSPVGQLLSSIALGRRAVDLPYEIRDRFIQAGLAHVLAASGFHVSLLLGVVLTLTRQFGGKVRLGIGLGILFVYVGLTGLQPSVMRAAIMGGGALLALSAERKVKPLGLLLLTATALLVFNPLWIWDLGFQLSFLATLGLIVTVPAIVKRLDWLPPAIATLIAVPLAASLWTLPLLVRVFNVVATYSIPLNILATPLISLISLGGMLSGLAASIFPPAGSAIAMMLYYPIQGTIGLVEFFTNLPGSSWAVGRISLGQLLVLYGLMVLVWQGQWFQRRWKSVAVVAFLLIVLPLGYKHLTQLQVTVLPAKETQIIAIQDRRNAIVIESGDEASARYTLLPFLHSQGINTLNLAIAAQNPLQGGWNEISEHLPIKRFFAAPDPQSSLEEIANRGQYQPLEIGQTLKLGEIAIRVIALHPAVLQLQIRDRHWLLIPGRDRPQNLPPFLLDRYEVLLWQGEPSILQEVQKFQPQVAIAASVQNFPQPPQNLQLYFTDRDGTVQWTPQGGWKIFSESDW